MTERIWQLEKIIEKEEWSMNKKVKILVVGSFVMDTISSTEIFPESGQTVLGYQYTTAPGGKGANQAMEAALLGAEVTMVGKVGTDAFGDRMIESLQSAGVNTDFVGRQPDVSSGIGNVMLTTKNGVLQNNRIIVIPGANMKITPEDVAFLKEAVGEYDMVMLQLEIPMEINELVAKYAYDKGVPVMLNPAPIAPLSEDFMSHITYLSPNETEAAALLNCFIREEGQEMTEEAIEGIKEAMRKKNLQKLLLTLGDAGAMTIDGENVVFKPAVPNIKAVDPTAAGDSFVAAFCVAKGSGLNDGDAMVFANMIAAVTVSKMGAQPSLSSLKVAKEFHKAAGRDVSIIEKVEELQK